MEPISLNCVRHGGINELYCVVCKSYVCSECVTDHGKGLHRPKYMDVMQYAPSQVLTKIDGLLAAVKLQETQADSDVKTLKEGLVTLVPQLKELTELHAKTAGFLQQMIAQYTAYSKRPVKGKYVDNIRDGLAADKLRLQKALKTKNTDKVLDLVQKLDVESRLEANKLGSAVLITNLERTIAEMEKQDRLKDSVLAASSLATKCRLLRFVQYISDWRCDSRYLSSKMSLSPDGLTFGNTSTNGYPAIIGNVLFDTEMYAFEVIPTSLDCAGKEGFGIIEHDKYLAAHRADSVTPTVYDSMIGFFHQNEAKNMTVDQITNMQMGSKYYVRVNMIELSVTITGPGVSLRADLKPGVVYVPCFSLGCANNKLQIRPLDDFNESERPAAAH